MKYILFAAAAVLVSAGAAAAKSAPPLPETFKAESSPATLAELIDVIDTPGSDLITLSTRYVVVVDPNGPKPKKPGLLNRAIVGSLTAVLVKSADRVRPRPSNATYLVASIDRATRNATYRVHHGRTISYQGDLIPEFKVSFADTSETTRDTKGWRSSGTCTRGQWIKTGFGGQFYQAPTCTYDQSYAFAVSPAIIEQAAAGVENSRYTNLTAGFMSFDRKKNTTFLFEVAGFPPSEVRALVTKVEAERTKLAVPSPAPVSAKSPMPAVVAAPPT